MKKIELIDYHQELEYKGIKFWCYNAGHVLGAAMFFIEIGFFFSFIKKKKNLKRNLLYRWCQNLVYR